MKRNLMTGAATAALLSISPGLNAAPMVAFTPSTDLELIPPENPAQGMVVQIKNDKGDKKAKAKGKDKKPKNQGKNAGSTGKKDNKNEAKKAAKNYEKAEKKARKSDDDYQRKDASKERRDRFERFSRRDDDERDRLREDIRKRGDRDDRQRARRDRAERESLAQTILNIQAPQGRDMRALLSAVPLALLGSNVAYSDIPQERLLTYRNCPPGLAKKDPPCVPPGLARDGVTYDDWVTYDDDRIDEYYRDRRRDFIDERYLDRDVELDDESFILNSRQIADLFDLGPAPSGQRYALIDGQPVLLTNEDYASLLRINDLARVPNLSDGIRIAPTAALTQSELRRTYKLPELEPGNNYAVVNGELVTLQDSAFETLQLIRIARAIF